MKKLIALLLALIMLLSLTACGVGDKIGDKIADKIVDSITDSVDKDKDDKQDKEKDNDDDPVLTDEEIEDFNNALEMLEALTPEGWDENSYGAYIYNVWDEEFLPDILPGPVEGMKADQTNFKDYKHDVINGDYSVGPIVYDSYEDYREYSVSVYATTAQLDAYVAELKAAGFTGGERSYSDSEWREFHFTHPDGWFLYIFYNTNADDGGNYDGRASIILTNDVHESPASIAGVKLPTAGVPDYDVKAYAEYETYVYATDEMGYLPVDWNGSFPDSSEMSWWIFFTYYGADDEYATSYVEELKSAGWELQWSNDQQDGYLNYALEKDGVYMVVDCFKGCELRVGFSDMIENISY